MPASMLRRCRPGAVARRVVVEFRFRGCRRSHVAPEPRRAFPGWFDWPSLPAPVAMGGTSRAAALP